LQETLSISPSNGKGDSVPKKEVALGYESYTSGPAKGVDLFIYHACGLSAPADELKTEVDIPMPMCQLGDLYCIREAGSALGAAAGIRWHPFRPQGDGKHE